jgi:hypothetical protein
VRFSVGIEKTENILKCVADALLIAEKVAAQSKDILM